MSHPFRPLFVEHHPMLTRAINLLRQHGHPPSECSYDDVTGVIREMLIKDDLDGQFRTPRVLKTERSDYLLSTYYGIQPHQAPQLSATHSGGDPQA